MEKSLLRYLQAVNRQLNGPLRSLISDAQSARLMKVTNGVLTRVIATTELETSRRRQLISACKLWCASLYSLLPHGDPILTSVAELDAAYQSAEPSGLGRIDAALVSLSSQLAQRHDAASQKIVSEIVNTEWQHWQRLEQRNAELLLPLAAAQTPSRGHLNELQQQCLLDLMRKECNESAALAISQVTPLSGGYSKQTSLVELQNAAHLPAQVVLRHDRPESPVGTSVSAEFPLLQVLSAEGVCVPRPWLVDNGETVGAPLMVVSCSPGRVISDGQHFYEKAGWENCALTLARQMAKFHQISLEKLPNSLPGRNDGNASIISRELEKFRQIWRDSEYQSPIAELTFCWLQSHMEFAGERKSLTHGDIRFQNILVSKPGVVTILDWELAAAQNPALDLGCTYHNVKQLVPWCDFLNAYRDAGGMVPSRETLGFYILRYELLCASFLTKIESGFLSGPNDMIDLAYAGTQIRQHSMLLLADTLNTLVSGADF